MKGTFGTLLVTAMLVLALPLNVLAADIEVNVSSTVPEEKISVGSIVGKVEVSVEDNSEPISTEPILKLEEISEAGVSETISGVEASSKVSIDCTPKEGYKLEDVTVKRNVSPDSPDQTPVDVLTDVQEPNVCTFRMPGFDVFVNIIFSKITGTSPAPVNPVPEPQSATVTPTSVSEEDNWRPLAKKYTEEAYDIVTASNAVGGIGVEFKIRDADERTKIYQKFLVQVLLGSTADILLTQNIYPRSELTMAEDGATKTLIWRNLPKHRPGPIYAVIYNVTDGAYVLNGILDDDGTAVFDSTGLNGFKLRNASTITICEIR